MIYQNVKLDMDLDLLTRRMFLNQLTWRYLQTIFRKCTSDTHIFVQNYFQDIKLITSANKHRFIVPGGVKQLTKEEFEAFTNQVKLKHFYHFMIIDY